MDLIVSIIWILGFTGGFYILGASLAIAGFIFIKVKKIPFSRIEYLALPLPFAIWSLLSIINFMPKSLSNLLEVFCVGGSVSALVTLRIIFRNTGKYIHHAVLMLSCIAAFLVYFIVPVLPV